ncbi:hypothetical protein FEP39_04674 [Burkholderia multivorans]|nr:hypothetical protein [Burkholderia multivorans]MDR9059741.1 hypothetical protein [Burkholderia multivorans]MDR9064817.1 hypothetical protein [Burkholderia multivorans]MDR9071434.1 hypothetical protein [Burkholderia multivorans]MDR9074504.1 hypothetical protein [Burkholderia multivorans]
MIARVRDVDKWPGNAASRSPHGSVSAGGRALYSAHCSPGPENAHLSDARSQRSKSGQCPTHGRSTVCRSRKASPLCPKAMSRRPSAQLPKNLTVTSAVSKIPMASNTYALQRIRLCRTVAPRKTSPFYANTESPTSKFAPERLTCAGNGHSKTEIFPAPGGLSGDIDRPSLPKSLTYAQFVCRSSSRKRSPLARSPDCETYPEEAHLMPIEVDEPPFRSRKLSPLQRHSRRIALLAGKTGFVSRKSSHQIAAKSRETSPFGKIA